MNASIDFFDRQFRDPPPTALELNPFERLALPYLRGEVLDFGCGLGNLAFAAAAQGCRVSALDASPAAIAHVRARADREGTAVHATQADLRLHVPEGPFDSVVSIGLLMFFDCDTALRTLDLLQQRVRPGGCAAVNVLTRGTDYMAMFDPAGHCLFEPGALRDRFAGWDVRLSELSRHPGPNGTVKQFATLIAIKPAPVPASRSGGTLEG